MTEARLTNEGSQPWEYTAGGDWPPIPSIEAHLADGSAVYGWKHGIAPHWTAIRHLAPGDALAQRTEFPAAGRVRVRAVAVAPGWTGMRTDEVEVNLLAP